MIITMENGQSQIITPNKAINYVGITVSCINIIVGILWLILVIVNKNREICINTICDWFFYLVSFMLNQLGLFNEFYKIIVSLRRFFFADNKSFSFHSNFKYFIDQKQLFIY